ncbi:MAG: site-specific DNA-methyltransferase, partial [Hyphomonadaceae bacterium]
CADSLAKASWTVALAGRRADLILTDSPYNVPILGNVSARHSVFVMGAGELSEAGFTAFLTTVFQHARAHARDGAFIYAFMDGAHLYELFAAARAARLTQKALCTWAKTNAGMGAFYRSQTEHVGVFKCGGGRHRNNIELGRHGRNRTTLWAYPGMNAFGRDRAAALKLHPTVKPVGLLADAILDVTRRADLVVDPFTGSGSTLLAAHRTGRAAAGIELDPAYVDVALTRIAAITGVDPVRAADGARWSALMQQRAAGGAP